MTNDDADRFRELLVGVHSFYRYEVSKFQVEVWWQALKALDYDAVRDAFNRHVLNPDNGQFCPKPADIVKLIGGGTADRALVAWSKFDLAVRNVGAWDSVVFDDPIIHQVADDMGGWRALCARTEKEWPFVQNEFVTRYRSYAMRPLLTYPAKLIGNTEAHNAGRFDDAVPPPKYIGDPARAAMVFKNGSEVSAKMRRIGELLPPQPSRLLEQK